MNGKSNVQAGLLGEYRALKLLRRQGMKLLAWRYRAAGGEVDLILRDGEQAVFCEVKYRPDGRPGDGLFAVDRMKRRRIRQAAGHWLLRHSGFVSSRFDVVEITRAGTRHIPDAF